MPNHYRGLVTASAAVSNDDQIFAFPSSGLVNWQSTQCPGRGRAAAIALGGAFLGGGSAATLKRTAFLTAQINFKPHTEELQEQSMSCEEDLAVCNRECERQFSGQEELEHPCKLAVLGHFFGTTSESGHSCFPAGAFVCDRHKGKLRMQEVQVGDEIAVGEGKTSRVLAMLHCVPDVVEIYLRIRCTLGVELQISPQHLLRARRRAQPPSLATAVNAERGTMVADARSCWEWLPAQSLRPGDELQDERGDSVTVNDVTRVGLQGAFAPLTASGALLVGGVLCSCYAPPAAWAVPHDVCHASMAPLRLLDSLRNLVESFSSVEGMKEPALTLDAIWLLPQADENGSMHPWALVLLRSLGALKALSQCMGLPPATAISALVGVQNAGGLLKMEPISQ